MAFSEAYLLTLFPFISKDPDFVIRKTLVIIFFLTLISEPVVIAQDNGEFNLARIKYRGGGDWYNDPSALRNLAEFTKRNAPVSINPAYDDVDIGSRDLMNYPFAFITGHGNITINDSELNNVRNWLNNGGFLYIDDDYGFDEYARSLINRLYPDQPLVELPFDHPIYNQVYTFTDGLPKVHEHDGLPPQGFALFYEGRMVIFYTYESNLADGWTNPEVHNTPPGIRQRALEMGANILVYALTSFK